MTEKLNVLGIPARGWRWIATIGIVGLSAWVVRDITNSDKSLSFDIMNRYLSKQNYDLDAVKKTARNEYEMTFNLDGCRVVLDSSGRTGTGKTRVPDGQPFVLVGERHLQSYLNDIADFAGADVARNEQLVAVYGQEVDGHYPDGEPIIALVPYTPEQLKAFVGARCIDGAVVDLTGPHFEPSQQAA